MRHVQAPDAVTGTQRYEQVLDAAFVMLHWHYDHPEFPDAIALLDDSSYHYFDVRGVVRTFALTVDDGGWSMVREGEDFWQRSSATFLGEDAMEGVGEISYDGGRTWQHDFAITYTRTVAAS